MRIAKRAFSFAFVLLAALPLVYSCRALIRQSFKSPKVRVIDIDFAEGPRELDKDLMAFTIRLAIDNPNDYPLNVVSVGYSACIGQTTIADGERRDDIRLGASGVTVVAVPLTIHFEAFKEAGRAIMEARAIQYEFNGSVGIKTPVVGVIRVPFSKVGTIDPLDVFKKKGFRLR